MRRPTGTPLVTGIDPALAGTINRPEGAEQATLANRPLYESADAHPGEWMFRAPTTPGFVVKPHGQRNLNCQ
ncbi:hypothetical protein P3102_05470 [Amycolatopsis sp. QT-25]|uniref:hypothetical protein n=1 Tax=Amycolatopsis sp. QT-25 TaxID=3034022 RepID=UPI0023EDD7E2|nr:hypothetical protein [Amycolatopsis sp. QT-25]WET80696.1 hypothetical protein P3102_05470 [Amycolatopsis sp. QT-25]